MLSRESVWRKSHIIVSIDDKILLLGTQFYWFEFANMLASKFGSGLGFDL